MNKQSLQELYKEKYGEEFTWENMDGLIKEIIGNAYDEQKKVCSSLYKERTTLTSGKFVGDLRIIELLEKAPTPEYF